MAIYAILALRKPVSWSPPEAAGFRPQVWPWHCIYTVTIMLRCTMALGPNGSRMTRIPGMMSTPCWRVRQSNRVPTQVGEEARL